MGVSSKNTNGNPAPATGFNLQVDSGTKQTASHLSDLGLLIVECAARVSHLTSQQAVDVTQLGHTALNEEQRKAIATVLRRCESLRQQIRQKKEESGQEESPTQGLSNFPTLAESAAAAAAAAAAKKAGASKKKDAARKNPNATTVTNHTPASDLKNALWLGNTPSVLFGPPGKPLTSSQHGTLTNACPLSFLPSVRSMGDLCCTSVRLLEGQLQD